MSKKEIWLNIKKQRTASQNSMGVISEEAEQVIHGATVIPDLLTAEVMEEAVAVRVVVEGVTKQSQNLCS